MSYKATKLLHSNKTEMTHWELAAKSVHLEISPFNLFCYEDIVILQFDFKHQNEDFSNSPDKQMDKVSTNMICSP